MSRVESRDGAIAPNSGGMSNGLPTGFIDIHPSEVHSRPHSPDEKTGRLRNSCQSYVIVCNAAQH